MLADWLMYKELQKEQLIEEEGSRCTNKYGAQPIKVLKKSCPDKVMPV
jgi:hypothetical protein